MPIVEYRVVAGRHTDAELGELLRRSCTLFAEVLGAPIGRVRAVATEYRPELMCVGGELVSSSAPEAVYFSFFLLAGRPVEHQQRLLAGFTDLAVECLGAVRELVRGGVVTVTPDEWAIAGVPASEARRAEVQARLTDQR